MILIIGNNAKVTKSDQETTISCRVVRQKITILWKKSAMCRTHIGQDLVEPHMKIIFQHLKCWPWYDSAVSPKCMWEKPVMSNNKLLSLRPAIKITKSSCSISYASKSSTSLANYFAKIFLLIVGPSCVLQLAWPILQIFWITTRASKLSSQRTSTIERYAPLPFGSPELQVFGKFPFHHVNGAISTFAKITHLQNKDNFEISNSAPTSFVVAAPSNCELNALSFMIALSLGVVTTIIYKC